MANTYKDRYFNKMGISSDNRSFINAGVLLMNLSLMRKYQIFQKEDMLQLILDNPTLNDQDIINKFFYNNTFVLNDVAYNFNPAFFRNYKNAYIIHYMQSKPWLEIDQENIPAPILKWRHSEKWVRLIDNLIKIGEK